GIEARDLESVEGELTPTGDLTDHVEVLLPERLRELVDHGREEPRGSGIHVFDRVETEPVHVGECDPELVYLAQMAQRRRDGVRVDCVHAVHDAAFPVMEILEAEEVAVRELGKEIEVADLALASESFRVLKLGRPDRSIGKRVRKIGGIDRSKR